MASVEQVAPVGSAEFYDALASGYPDISQARLPYLDAIDDLVIAKARVITPNSYMDIGCGDGRRTLKIAAALGIEDPLGVDESREMLARSELSRTMLASVAELDTGSELDVITALWNVFGHVPTQQRQLALRNIGRHLRPGGLFMLDVSNRYNARAYGHEIVSANMLVDSRGGPAGDVTAHHEVDGVTYATVGHVFHPEEIEGLLADIPLLRIKDKQFIDYATGESVASASEGQIFYELTKP
jgi:SAM-dependent methyltransferase